MKLIYRNSAGSQRDKILKSYPALKGHFSVLERLIAGNPEAGIQEFCLLPSGKIIPYRRQSVRLNFFSERYVIGYDKLSALYLFNSELVAIMEIYFS